MSFMNKEKFIERIGFYKRTAELDYKVGDVIIRDGEYPAIISRLPIDGDQSYRGLEIRHRSDFDRKDHIVDGAYIEAGNIKLWAIADTATIIGGEKESPTGRKHYLIRMSDKKVWYVAGCRNFSTFEQAERHWTKKVSERYRTTGAAWKLREARRLFTEAAKLGWIKNAPPKLLRPAKKVPVKKAGRK